MLYRNVRVGARVLVQLDEFPNDALVGTVRYKGRVVMQRGVWVGLEMDTSVQGHSGLYWGQRYFECQDGHGVFVKPAALDFIPSPRRSHNSYRKIAKNCYIDEDLFERPLYVKLQESQTDRPLVADQWKPKPTGDVFRNARMYRKACPVSGHMRAATATGSRSSTQTDQRDVRSPSGHGSIRQAFQTGTYRCSTPSIPSTHNPLIERHHHVSF
ncbi:uncharacterized protein LOC134196229 [Corticium candelabrum]|uniref:uncharacterized protein LOC134196229 n=1 Tax=Corticium candelabrum TaxID=121492 RepID=UPI002E26EECF|nr:uncharacterized protein LOC134196229 [Corticium candelabrum]